MVMQGARRYFGSEKCKPEALPNDFWIIIRSSRQIFDGRMVTFGKLVKPRLSSDKRF